MQLKRIKPTEQGFIKDKTPVRLPKDTMIGKVKYELFGVVNHSGTSMHNGHYTANVKLESRWKVCDDLKVYDNILPICSKEAYLLFFERK